MLMWVVGNMETPPPRSWVTKLLVATQVRQQQSGTSIISRSRKAEAQQGVVTPALRQV
jgi:hypothetical protein